VEGRASRRAEAAALGALGFLLAVTAAWWALALWPTADEPPARLARARWVCFNAGPSGLPDASGWLVLIGEPLGLGVALFAAFGRSLRLALRAAAASRGGIAAMSACAAAILVGLSAAGVRVANAAAARDPVAITGSAPVPSTYPRLDCPAPALGLIDQVGARIDLDALRGRPALVTFAFAHCETVCPALVSQTLAAQRRARAGGDPSRVPRIAIVTLDPWRDTPARLPALADAWRLGRDASVLSGPPAEVNAALDAWNVPRTRNPSTGQLDHPALVYVLDPSGRIAYAANGDEHTLSALLERL
jgi:protein SCO1/2